MKKRYKNNLGVVGSDVLFQNFTVNTATLQNHVYTLFAKL